MKCVFFSFYFYFFTLYIYLTSRLSLTPFFLLVLLFWLFVFVLNENNYWKYAITHRSCKIYRYLLRWYYVSECNLYVIGRASSYVSEKKSIDWITYFWPYQKISVHQFSLGEKNTEVKMEEWMLIWRYENSKQTRRHTHLWRSSWNN